MKIISRFVMYFMFFGTSTLHFLTREMAPMLVPMICSEFGYSTQQRGLLLGSYFPGYIVAQIPSAMLAGKIGCRNTFTLCNLGTITRRGRCNACHYTRAAPLCFV